MHMHRDATGRDPKAWETNASCPHQHVVKKRVSIFVGEESATGGRWPGHLLYIEVATPVICESYRFGPDDLREIDELLAFDNAKEKQKGQKERDEPKP